MEAERFVRESDIETQCRCAARKCGPHRCRLSISGWIVVGLLSAYLIYLHSAFFAERTTLWDKWRTAWTDATNHELADYRESLHKSVRLDVDDATADLRASQRHLEAQVQAAHSDIERLHDVIWAYTTPELERSMQLKLAITQLTERLDAVSGH